MVKIAVIADTHGHLPESIRPQLRKADQIWHLGDFCDLSTLETVRNLGPPVRAVAGNNDFGLHLPSRLGIEIAGFKFELIHIPPNHPSGPQFLLHGHTHVPRDERVGKTRILSPGSIGKANKGAPASFAWLQISESPSPWIGWSIQRIEF